MRLRSVAATWMQREFHPRPESGSSPKRTVRDVEWIRRIAIPISNSNTRIEFAFGKFLVEHEMREINSGHC